MASQLERKPVLSRTRQACEACKARKVRCNGQSPCQQCNHLNLRCSYLALKQRGKNAQRGTQIKEWLRDNDPSQANPRLLLPAHQSSFFLSFLESYAEHVYPFQPIISPGEARSALTCEDDSQEGAAFAHALVATCINLSNVGSTLGSETLTQLQYWTEKSIRLLDPVLSAEAMTVRRIITVQFLHGCLMGLRKYDVAFYYLRMSTTMVYLLRPGDDAYMASLSSPERARRQRLYWQIFIHERFMALGYNHSAVLPPLDRLPEQDDTIPPGIDRGFRQIVRLFAHIDFDFLAKWNHPDVEKERITSSWIADKHRAIQGEHIDIDNRTNRLSGLQLADLVITKSWLQMLVWKIAISQCLLTSSTDEEDISLLFPIRVSAELRPTVRQLPRAIIASHGNSMQKKLFELTDTIANIVLTIPAAAHIDNGACVDDLRFLTDLMFSLPDPIMAQIDILQSKVEVLRSRIPEKFG